MLSAPCFPFSPPCNAAAASHQKPEKPTSICSQQNVPLRKLPIRKIQKFNHHGAVSVNLATLHPQHPVTSATISPINSTIQTKFIQFQFNSINSNFNSNNSTSHNSANLATLDPTKRTARGALVNPVTSATIQTKLIQSGRRFHPTSRNSVNLATLDPHHTAARGAPVESE